MSGKYQRLRSAVAPFPDTNATVVLPPLPQSRWPVPALLGPEWKQEVRTMGRGLWACLRVRGCLLSAVGTSGWKYCQADTDGAYVALSPAAGAQRVVPRADGDSGCCPG